MEAELNDFFEKLEKNKLDNENRTKEIKFNIDDIKIDFFNSEKDIKENALSQIKEDEIIKKEDFDEDAKEDEVVVNPILEDLNKNILINVKEEEEDKNQMACREILEILRYPLSQKNVRGVISPFKPLLQPKKVSMVGKVFYNSTTDNDENKTRDNTGFNGRNDVK
jgi:hypothetical protein